MATTTRPRKTSRDKIKAIMEKQGRKWVWLAAETGYSRTHITSMMSGDSDVPARFVRLAALALGVKPETLS